MKTEAGSISERAEVEATANRAVARALVDARGLNAAAKALGVSRESVARYVAGLRNHPGTQLRIEVGLAELTAAAGDDATARGPE